MCKRTDKLVSKNSLEVFFSNEEVEVRPMLNIPQAMEILVTNELLSSINN